MAQDVRPYKSKEQDGQGNEIILRDQQLVEQTSQTTMASGEYFEIVDVDGRMAKIPKANMMSVVLEAIRLLLDDSGSNISAANLTKILGLSASSIGNILPADLASVLGGLGIGFKYKPRTAINDLWNGFCDYDASSLDNNLPDSKIGVAIAVTDSNSDMSFRCLQIFMTSSSDVYFRVRWSAWGSWKKVS